MSGDLEKEIDQGIQNIEDEKASEAAEEAVADEVVEEAAVEDVAEEQVAEVDDDLPESSDEQEAESEDKSEEEAEASKPAGVLDVPPELMARALKAGVSVVDAKSFESIESLSRTLDLIDSSDSSEETQQEEEDVFKDIPELDPEEYDEKLISVVDGLKKMILDQKKQIDRTSAKANDADVRSAIEDATAKFDSAVNSLGDEYDDILGKGTFDSIKSDERLFKARSALANRISILSAGYKAVGQVKSEGEVFSEALAIEFPDAKKAQGKVDSSESKQRASQIIERAGRTRGTPRGDVETEIGAEIDKRFGS